MGRVCVSSCRCCVFVSVVHQVAILSVVFCVICSLLMWCRTILAPYHSGPLYNI